MNSHVPPAGVQARWLRSPRHGLVVALMVFWVTFTGHGASVPVSSASSSTTTVRFIPVADTFVSRLAPSTNFGSARRLEADGSPEESSYLRFVVESGAGRVANAVLRLYCQNPSEDNGGTIATVSDTAWDEYALTFDERPAIDGQPLARLGPVQRGSWYEVDVTRAIAGPGTYSFGVSNDRVDGADFASREETGLAPELVVRFDQAEPAPDPTPLPGRVEAEDYDAGGEGIGYHDTTPGNRGGDYRLDDVDIESASSGGFNVGWFEAGEWLRYTVDVQTAGDYAVQLKVATPYAGKTVTLEIDNVQSIDAVPVPDTGAWQTWTTTSAGIVSLTAGLHTLRITTDTGLINVDYLSFLLQDAENVLVGAGDIAVCNGGGDEATADLLDTIPGTVITLGDNAYPDGTAADFEHCYDPSWGRHQQRTRPALGNHEYYGDAEASGYFGYFGTAAGEPGKGYYSYDVGSWHVVVINSNCSKSGGCGAGDPQVQWLRQDLAAHPASCTVAYMHHPLFSSGSHGSDPNMYAFWEALYQAGADVVIAAHNHAYERFAPMDPDGNRDDERGIRSFVVGTGGAPLRDFDTIVANSEIRDSATHGVLKLTLYESGYQWQFIPVTGETFADSGQGLCH